nr:winged helix DNA-binding domain-containing protein [Nocardioidaceae bacterium]
MNRTITVAERRARLALRHRLLPEDRSDDVARIAEDLVALHSSDPVSVYLSAWARMRSPSVEAVERALYVDRTLIRHHAMRRTLWVASRDTVRLMHGAATRKLVGPEERRTLGLLRASGVDDPTAWLAAAREQVLAVLLAHGPMSARALGAQIPALRLPLRLAVGKPYEGTAAAHTRVLLQLGFEGRILRGRPTGTWVNGAYTYATADSWLDGGLGDLDERAAAGPLADLWLRRFGPATSTDLQWWMGWTAALTTHALSASRAVPVELEPAAGSGRSARSGWVAEGDEEVVGGSGRWVAVLPGLDPTVMGWKQRDWYLHSACADAFDRFGNAGPTLWVDGRVVGAWAQARAGELRTHYFVPVPAGRRREIDVLLDRLRSLVGETRFSVRFPGRIQA